MGISGIRSLAIVCCLLSVSTFADNRKGRQIEQLFAAPEPDALMPAPSPDRPLPPVRELRPLIRHTVNQQQGIDVSHYQGHIDWDEVARDNNVQFVYIKATEGSDLVDNCYMRNLYGARRVGIPVGVYHFYRPNVNVQWQLRNFSSTVEPWQHDLIPIVDVEKRGKGSLSQFQSRLKAFLDGVERIYGVKPIIYTGVNFYAAYLEGRFTQYRFMVARYADEFPGLSEDVPIVLWQYTSKGQIDGIRGHVDRSVFLDRYTLTDILLPSSVGGKK